MKKTIETITTISIWVAVVCAFIYAGFIFPKFNIQNTISVGLGSYTILNTFLIAIFSTLNIHENNKLELIFIENKKFIIGLFFFALFYELKIIYDLLKQ